MKKILKIHGITIGGIVLHVAIALGVVYVV